MNGSIPYHILLAMYGLEGCRTYSDEAIAWRWYDVVTGRYPF